MTANKNLAMLKLGFTIGIKNKEASNILKDHKREDRAKVLGRVLRKHFKNVHPLLKKNPKVTINHMFDSKLFSPTSSIELRTKDGKNPLEGNTRTADAFVAKRLFRDKFDFILDSLYLKEKYKGKGIGKAVLGAWMDTAKEIGISNIEFDADDQGKYIWPKMKGVEWNSTFDKVTTNLKYRVWRLTNGGPPLGINAEPGAYPTEFLKNWGGLMGPSGMLSYKIPLEKVSRVGDKCAKELAHIFITGPHGSGKTTLSKKYKTKFNLPILNLDDIVNDGLDWKAAIENLTERHIVEGAQLLLEDQPRPGIEILKADRNKLIERLVLRGWKPDGTTIIRGEAHRGEATSIADNSLAILSKALHRWGNK